MSDYTWFALATADKDDQNKGKELPQAIQEPIHEDPKQHLPTPSGYEALSAWMPPATSS